MEYLIKLRGRFSAQETKEEPDTGSSKDRILPQKTTSFKGEKKRPQNWLRKQFSWQMSQNRDSSGIAHDAAVAAATYAIVSMKASSIPEQENIREEAKHPLFRTKSKKEDKAVSFSEPGQGSKRFSGESLRRSSENPESDRTETSSLDEKIPAKAVAPSSSMKKTPSFTDKAPVASIKKAPSFTNKPSSFASTTKAPTFTDKTSPARSTTKTPSFPDKPASAMEKIHSSAKKELNSADDTKPEEAASQMHTHTPKHEMPGSTRTGGAGETKADAWERAELEKIKKRYEELNERIISWQKKKTAKARQRLNRIEGDLEQKRLKALEKYRSDVENINQIAEGASAKAKERQRKEELKVRAKADKIRETGEVPKTCFCF